MGKGVRYGADSNDIKKVWYLFSSFSGPNSMDRLLPFLFYKLRTSYALKSLRMQACIYFR
jgi:hypothetical protein